MTSLIREIDPSQPTLSYSFRIFGGGSNGILMTYPVLAVVGNDLAAAMPATQYSG